VLLKPLLLWLSIRPTPHHRNPEVCKRAHRADSSDCNLAFIKSAHHYIIDSYRDEM
jgi:hypothetical protein